MPPEDPPTLYEWAGGTEAFERWLNTFYDLVEQDAGLAPAFGGTVSQTHRTNVVAWWAEVMGGPARYTEEHGGYERMLAHHRGLPITPDLRLRFVTLLSSGRRCRPARRSRVPRRDRGLRRMGLAPGPAQLGPRRGGGAERAGAALGLGRGSSVPALGGA